MKPRRFDLYSRSKATRFQFFSLQRFFDFGIASEVRYAIFVYVHVFRLFLFFQRRVEFDVSLFSHHDAISHDFDFIFKLHAFEILARAEISFCEIVEVDVFVVFF